VREVRLFLARRRGYGYLLGVRSDYREWNKQNPLNVQHTFSPHCKLINAKATKKHRYQRQEIVKGIKSFSKKIIIGKKFFGPQMPAVVISDEKCHELDA
jgi:hypothetical protein